MVQLKDAVASVVAVSCRRRRRQRSNAAATAAAFPRPCAVLNLVDSKMKCDPGGTGALVEIGPPNCALPAPQASAAHTAFCTRGTYIRYLRARSWNLAKATKVCGCIPMWQQLPPAASESPKRQPGSPPPVDPTCRPAPAPASPPAARRCCWRRCGGGQSTSRMRFTGTTSSRKGRAASCSSWSSQTRRDGRWCSCGPGGCAAWGLGCAGAGRLQGRFAKLVALHEVEAWGMAHLAMQAGGGLQRQ